MYGDLWCKFFLNFSYVLDGVPRMRERPIGDLVVGLKQLGADVDCFLGTDCPPVRIKGIGGLPGGKVSYQVPHATFSCRWLNSFFKPIHLTVKHRYRYGLSPIKSYLACV